VVRKSMRDSLHLRGDTLKTLNNIMQDPVRAVAESTTLVVASLVAIEVRSLTHLLYLASLLISLLLGC
jgi:hypothetical protein